MVHWPWTCWWSHLTRILQLSTLSRPPGPCHQGRQQEGGLQEGWLLSAEEDVVRGSDREGRDVGFKLWLCYTRLHELVECVYCAYLLLFSVFIVSIYFSVGQVSSKRWICFLWLSKITMSGFSAVTHISGGIEPPPAAVCPGRSLNTMNFVSTEFTMQLTMQLCLHVNLPVSSETLQPLRTWFVVSRLLQSLQRS